MSSNPAPSQRYDSVAPTRVIMVQGPTQLLTVVSVLHYQQAEEGLAGFTDILLIGGLSHLEAPNAALYAACMEIAKAWKFSAVIDLTRIEREFYTGRRARILEGILQPARFSHIPGAWRIGSLLGRLQERLFQRWLFPKAVAWLREAIASTQVKYVYTCRNTQFVNELTLSAFPEAVRICYGDGLGWIALNKSFGSPTFNSRGFLPMHRAYLITPVETMPGHLDLLQLTVVPHRFYVETLNRVANTCDKLRNKATHLLSLGAGLPITVALTSHLADLGFMASVEDELTLYRTYILPHITQQEFVLIKGHPREAHGHSELLARQLRAKGFRCVAMTDTAQFPIELFAPLLPIHKIVNYCSAGFIGLLMVRPCPVVLGLGAAAYREKIKFNDQVEAIRSEHVLILLVQQAFAGKFSPIRLSDPQYVQTKLPDYPTLVCPPSGSD